MSNEKAFNCSKNMQKRKLLKCGGVRKHVMVKRKGVKVDGDVFNDKRMALNFDKKLRRY